MEGISFQVLDRKLPREGICRVLVADQCSRKRNVAKIKTEIVISEKDMPNCLRDAEYEFPVMVEEYKAMEVFERY